MNLKGQNMLAWLESGRKLPRWSWGLAACLLCSPCMSLAQTHVVRPGDTLWGVAKDKLEEPRRWVELQQRNGVDVPRLLQPGKVLDLGATTQGAVVAELEGSAWLKRRNLQQALTVGTVVQPGDVLATQENAFVQLNLADGSRVVLPSGSALRIDSLDGKTIRLHLLEGRVESHVQKQTGQRAFEVRTRSVGLGVRGTHFRVRDEAGVVASEVLEGEVVAISDAVQGGSGAARQAVLFAGKGATLEGVDSFSVKALLPAPQLLPRTPGNVDSRALLLTPMPLATGYRLQLARDERFLSLVHEQRSTQPQFTLPPQVDDDLYHVRFTAFDQYGLEGVPGDSLISIAPAPQPLVSATVQRLPDGRYEVRWPGTAGSRYRFMLSRQPDFALRLAEDPSVQGSGMVLGPLALPGRYYWRSEEVTAVPTGNGVPGIPVPAQRVFGGSFDVPPN